MMARPPRRHPHKDIRDQWKAEAERLSDTKLQEVTSDPKRWSAEWRYECQRELLNRTVRAAFDLPQQE
jgi:hypothetical protein